jgi:hypothetical protein
MGFEEALGNSIFNQPSNKAYTDKLLAVMQADKIELLVKKDMLSASDLRLLQTYLSSNETKLVNLGDKSRYLLGKYLSWIQQFIELQQFHIKATNSLIEKGLQTNLSGKNNNTSYKLMDEYIKTIVNSFLFWLRSGMSLNMSGFKTLNSNTYEFQYGQPQLNKPTESKGIFGGK